MKTQMTQNVVDVVKLLELVGYKRLHWGDVLTKKKKWPHSLVGRVMSRRMFDEKLYDDGLVILTHEDDGVTVLIEFDEVGQQGWVALLDHNDSHIDPKAEHSHTYRLREVVVGMPLSNAQPYESGRIMPSLYVAHMARIVKIQEASNKSKESFVRLYNGMNESYHLALDHKSDKEVEDVLRLFRQIRPSHTKEKMLAHKNL